MGLRWLKRMLRLLVVLFVMFGLFMVRDGSTTTGVVLIALGLVSLTGFGVLVVRDQEDGKSWVSAVSIVGVLVIAVLAGAFLPT